MEQWKIDSVQSAWCPTCFFVLGHPTVLLTVLWRPGTFPSWKLDGLTWRLCSSSHSPCLMGTLSFGEAPVIAPGWPSSVLFPRGLHPAPAPSSLWPTFRGDGPRGLTRGECPRAGPSLGAVGGRPRPPRAGRGGRAEARGEGGQRRGEWPGRPGPINSPRRGGGGRSRRSRRRRCRCCRAAPAESAPRTAPRPPRPQHDGGDPPAGRGDLGRPVLRNLAPLRLRRWLLSPRGGAGAGGRRGAGPREAGGTPPLPARKQPRPPLRTRRPAASGRSPRAVRRWGRCRARRFGSRSAGREQAGRRRPWQRWRAERVWRWPQL